MAHSLSILRISNHEQELKNAKRLRKLLSKKHFASVLGSFIFLFFSLMCLYITYLWLLAPGAEEMATKEWLICLSVMVVVTLVFAGGAVAFSWGIFKDPLFLYLFKPQLFSFHKAQVVSSKTIVIRGDKRSHTKILATVLVEDGDKTYSFQEYFAPEMFPFIEKESEEGLTPEDDWYSEIGKRPYLPIAAYVLASQELKKMCLIGIEADAADRALKYLDNKWREESRDAIKMVAIVTIILVLVTLFKYFYTAK